MDISDFTFELPEELIAQWPASERALSRLLQLNGADGAVTHSGIADLPALLAPGDLLVVNDTRVMPARIYATKASGGRAELLVERIGEAGRVLAHIRARRAPKPGTQLVLHPGREAGPDTPSMTIDVCGRQGDLFELVFPADTDVLTTLETFGRVPLPPYIKREEAELDRVRYQTVFARESGAVAAPTAGLHFDASLLAALEAAGVECARVTLHVGAGTFQPVRTERLEDHRMHSERYRVSPELVAAIERCRDRSGRVVAVGTTTLRALESAAAYSEVGVPEAGEGETDIFVLPGYRFRCIDALVTNFHLPGSTLLMLVSALGGREHVLAAYRQAVAERYRFYSYGDAMLIWPHALALFSRRQP